MATTQQLMNEVPRVTAFIAINANYTGPMIQEIGRRTQVEPYYIYTFDDGVESNCPLRARQARWDFGAKARRDGQ